MVLSARNVSDESELPPGFHEFEWTSRSLHKRMTYVIYFPPGYGQEPGRRYPVLYLLHGSGHTRRSVLRQARPQDCISALGETLLVIPDGDQGWWLDSPRQAASRYGEYFMELVARVDADYLTDASAEGRGICGFSMGGYGAMLLASQHTDLCISASSLLGPLDIAQMFPNYYRLRQLLGPDLAQWQHYNPTERVADLLHTRLRFCTANASFDRAQNDAFATALRARGVSFGYELFPGCHDTAFVQAHMVDHFQFHRQLFRLV